MPRAARTASTASDVSARRDAVLAELARTGETKTREGLGRFGIVVSSGTVYGVPMSALHRIAKPLGRDQALALALWETGAYEARMLCSFVGDPGTITASQMDAWCRDCDNWAIVDTLCFHLFLRTPHAFAKIAAWSRAPGEFQKRAAFALLASVALRVKETPPERLREGLALIEQAAGDERNFVKKAVNWALRGIGTRDALADEARALAARLAASDDRTARWIGKDALKAFARVKKARPARSPSARARKSPKSG